MCSSDLVKGQFFLASSIDIFDSVFSFELFDDLLGDNNFLGCELVVVCTFSPSDVSKRWRFTRVFYNGPRTALGALHC